MDFRLASSKDIPGTLELQSKNLVSRISEEEKKNGFVTTPFTDEQLEALIDLEGLFVIDADGLVSGYAVAAGWDYFRGRPMFDYMLELFRRIEYKGRRIDESDSFQYGPVCVDSRLRGTDAFPKLFGRMKAGMAAKYPIGTTFINRINARSFRAHTSKANLDVIAEFEFNGNAYYGLAFLTSE